MTQELVAEQVGLARFGRDAEASADELGPLADLVGTWIGSNGWELIAVPKAMADGAEAFELITAPYVEIVTFVPIGAPVPDRGGNAGNLFLTGLKYEMRIADAETNEPLHLENGMWFYMEGQEQEIARSSAIPHGDCLLALGTSTTATGPPTIPVVDATPDGQPVNAPFGYLDEYHAPDAPLNPQDMTASLRKTLEGQNVTSTTTLSVSTAAPGGGVLNIPFVTAHADATAFTSTYWIESIEIEGQTVMQLQYVQQTNIDFFQKSDGTGLICWPHVNVNTLSKQ